MTVWVIRGCEGVGDIPGVRGGFRGSVGSVQRRLDCHKNSDLRSEVGIGTSLNSTMRCLIESVALLTKLMGIVTPLVLSIVVVVALRLISYTEHHKSDIRLYRTMKVQPKNEIILYHTEVTRLYRTWGQDQIVSYMGFDGGKGKKK